MNFEDLVEQATQLIGCQPETEDGTDYILELELGPDHNQIVYMWLDTETELEHASGQAYVFLEADVANYTDDIDAVALLKECSSFVLCRLYIDETEDDNIAVQAALPLATLTPQLLAAAVFEVATEADRLEDALLEED